MSTISFGRAINEALHQEMERDERVFVFGLDVADHKAINGSTAGLAERFGNERCFSTPVSEDAMTGLALGAALNGLRPVHVHIRVDFLLLAMNQIGNMISAARYMSGGQVQAPLVIRAIVGRGWGQGAQHSKSLQGVFAHFPGLKVAMPTSPDDAKGLLVQAIRDDDPVVFLEHRWLYDIQGPTTSPHPGIPLGQARIVRPGADVSVIATSWMVIEALQAAEILAERGVQVEVVDPRTAVPLDRTTLLESVARTRHCVIADNDWSFCSFGSELSALVSEELFDSLERPVVRVGWAHAPCPTVRSLEQQFYSGARHIVRAIEKQLDLPPAELDARQTYTYENRFRGPF
jgi:acetoin:2,6-dichlorophenolindophenol oxidoreductase subunit beta